MMYLKAALLASLSLLLIVQESAAKNGPITRAEVLTRSKSWIDERVMYSQSKWHKNKYGSYRQDCSGYVSMAWNLDQSYTTYSLPKFMKDIRSSDLKAGDALWKSSHIALFVRWAKPGSPVVREEYKTGKPASERTWSNSYFRTFKPKRFNKIR